MISSPQKEKEKTKPLIAPLYWVNSGYYGLILNIKLGRHTTET